MKRWLYIGGGIVVGLLIVVAIGLYFVFSSLDSIVKTAIENYGSDMTQTAVSLDDVKIELTSGKGTLRGLTVNNPRGFKTKRALRLGEISLQLDVGSVTKDPIVIKEIAITAPEVTYEFGLKGNNLDTLERNVDAYTGQEKSKTSEANQKSEKPGKKLVIENLYIRKGRVNVSATELEGKSATASLPDIHLTDIGKKSGGATVGEVAEQVLGAISRGAASAAATTNIGGLLDKLKGGGASTATEAAQGAEKRLKGLFGK